MAGSGGAAREKGQKWHLARQPTSTQKTGDHAQMPGVVRREIRTIRRKSDYLKPSLQQVESDTHRKGIRNRCQPLRRDGSVPAAILRGRERCPVRAFKETERPPKSCCYV